MNILTVIYDDRCGLCVAARKWAERRCGETVFFYPASQAGALMTRKQIDPRLIETGIIVLESDTILIGYRAVLRVLKRSGIPRWLLSLTSMPGIRFLGSILYRFLASHRRLASRLLRLTPQPVPTGTCSCGGGCAN